MDANRHVAALIHMHACTLHALVQVQGLKVQVRRDYDDFIQEMVAKFPHEEAGIKAFYQHCWNIFNRCAKALPFRNRDTWIGYLDTDADTWIPMLIPGYRC